MNNAIALIFQSRCPFFNVGHETIRILLSTRWLCQRNMNKKQTLKKSYNTTIFLVPTKTNRKPSVSQKKIVTQERSFCDANYC